MPWNWALPKWPSFQYDPQTLENLEKEFLLSVGSSAGFIKSLDEEEYRRFVVEILSTEGLESSKIEGEYLDRESLQSSILRHFDLKEARKKAVSRKEKGMANVLLDAYDMFKQPLSHEMLWKWHSLLFEGYEHVENRGRYRSDPEPMQIVSNRYGSPTVFFEAPPSATVFSEMKQYIEWFNRSASSGSILGRAAIAHVYFESIHPFEDGNGRLGRVLVEKVLSQGVRRPVLVAISKNLDKRKKEYYSQLERCNRTLHVQGWVEYFSQVILESQKESTNLLFFLIKKSKLMRTLSGQLNTRQEKALLRMFSEGPDGFKGGLSAENYIAITGATRPTATRDLTDLVKKKALIKTGDLRHTRYWLNLDSI